MNELVTADAGLEADLLELPLEDLQQHAQCEMPAGFRHLRLRREVERNRRSQVANLRVTGLASNERHHRKETMVKSPVLM